MHCATGKYVHSFMHFLGHTPVVWSSPGQVKANTLHSLLWQEWGMLAELYQALPCCCHAQVTTINQATAEEGREPLTTLATFRSASTRGQSHSICQ